MLLASGLFGLRHQSFGSWAFSSGISMRAFEVSKNEAAPLKSRMQASESTGMS